MKPPITKHRDGTVSRKPKTKADPNIAIGDGWQLSHGRWQDVLADVTCDLLLSDPPYSDRVHGSEPKYDPSMTTSDPAGLTPTYAAWSSNDVHEFVRHWSPRTRGWMVTMTSHDLIPAWEAAYAEVDRFCFQPLPALIPGMSVRLCGDGPSSWSIWIVVARPRSKPYSTWGTLAGGYYIDGNRGASGGRGKPLQLCNALVRDYSRLGDVVADPMCGWGSSLSAALSNGRSAIGAEMDRAAYDESVRRLRRGGQIDLLSTLSGVA